MRSVFYWTSVSMSSIQALAKRIQLPFKSRRRMREARKIQQRPMISFLQIPSRTTYGKLGIACKRTRI
jgi:hypothetical protein